MPDDRYTRAQVLQWMFFEQYEHEPAIAVARFLIGYSRCRARTFEKRLPRLWDRRRRRRARHDGDVTSPTAPGSSATR